MKLVDMLPTGTKNRFASGICCVACVSFYSYLNRTWVSVNSESGSASHGVITLTASMRSKIKDALTTESEKRAELCFRFDPFQVQMFCACISVRWLSLYVLSHLISVRYDSSASRRHLGVCVRVCVFESAHMQHEWCNHTYDCTTSVCPSDVCVSAVFRSDSTWSMFTMSAPYP